MVELLAVLGAVLVVLLAIWAWRRASAAADGGPERQPWAAADEARGARVVLDLTDVDPDDASTRRLVKEAAHRVLASDPELEEVEVVGRDGRRLARERRPPPIGPSTTLPDSLRVHRGTASHTPSPVERHDVKHPDRVLEPPPTVRSAPLAERLDLPASVRAELADPDDAAGLVLAIVRAAGRPAERDGDLIRTGEVAIAVADVHHDADRALTHAFLRIQATDAPRGLIIRLGYVDPAIIRRREAAAAHVRHVGPDALQRMADAVAVGADPVAFAAGPVVVT